MNTASIKLLDSFHIGSSIDLSDHQVKQLVALFNKPSRPVNSVLGGRTSATAGHINGIGDVVVKHYTRGGFIRHFVKKRYLRWGKIRSRVEFEVLQKVRQHGINAPRPIAYAYQGALYYRAWLVTEEIRQHQTLAQLSLTDPDLACLLTGKVVGQIAALIDNDIFHVDLHPGNVLVDHKKNIFLIDFDKTRFTQIPKDKLRRKYGDRWKRAVIKHRLPDRLYDAMNTALVK
ncbi:MAG: lipopolysaccharide kinase InaA family protein [Desulfobacterales bacterium]|jgi:3-deoxy-D-manno-octulosonic acid kinase